VAPIWGGGNYRQGENHQSISIPTTDQHCMQPPTRHPLPTPANSPPVPRSPQTSAPHPPGYTAAELGPCAAQLLHLHGCASLSDAVPAYQPLAFVREKYAQVRRLCA
jgi:hypothetical protein